MARKKYWIVDGDGNEFNVEEQLDADETEVFEEEKIEEPVGGEGLSEEEITALKRLAAVADKLIAVVETSDACGKDEGEEEEVEEEEIIDEDEEEFREEEIIDTDEVVDKKARDSKRSMGAIERKRTRQDDSLTDPVAEAWAKRYGGNK